MGDYTELYLSCSLKGIPKDVLMLLDFWFGENGDLPMMLPNHELFLTDRWKQIGTMSSYYFVPMATSQFYLDHHESDEWHLTTRFDLKNYDNEIAKFLDFIAPYIDEGYSGHIGHIRYEEDLQPTLLFLENGKIEKK